MSRIATIMLSLFAFSFSLSGAMAATTQILCTDMPNVSCDGDFSKADTCRTALGDTDVQKKINSDVCCTGSPSAKVFTVPAAPTPPAEDKICSDFSMKVSGKGANRKLSIKVDSKNCNGDVCSTQEEGMLESEACALPPLGDSE